MENTKPDKIETVLSPERGANILMSIDLIRHPEKDPSTGKLTQSGKDSFFNQLRDDLGGNEEYDIIKFYVSPLSRGQEAKEPITKFMEASGINTSIRNKEELVGKFREVGPEFKKEMTTLLEERDQLTREQAEIARIKDESIPTYEPANKDFETKTNELLIGEFFEKILPGTTFTGKENAEIVKALIDHFSELASRLKSGSKVKLVLVGHSGVIEYFTKYVYLQNHPDISPSDVKVEDIGGLVGFSEGPEITIQSDANGDQKINFRFKDLSLDYNI